jgi:hypothetical protein
MTKSLGQILRDDVVDNTFHQVRDSIFTAGHQREPTRIEERNDFLAWRFMTEISARLNEQLRSSERSEIVLLGAGDYEHNTQDDFLRMSGGFNHNDFSFSTGNLIGCVTGMTEGQQFIIRISSRFGDEFLKYIIADTDGFLELPDQGGTGSGGYEWLLCYLWLIKLKKAFRMGLPKSYETKKETLPGVRGRLDVVDYFRNSELARYACTYREHSYDNGATRLIARTLEHLDARMFLRNEHQLNQTFQVATAGRRHSLRDLFAVPLVRNPYYADYNPVLALSKRILRNDLANVGEQDKTSAFLFDVSMLFEYFIRKLIQRAGVSVRDKTQSTWFTPRGQPNSNSQRKLIPDLVFDIQGRSFVFDVKYKRFPFHDGVAREDMFQIHTYVGQAANESEVGGCGFIYPVLESRWKSERLDSLGWVWTSTIMQGRREVPFHVAFLMVPERGDTPEGEWPAVFQNRFKKSIETFVQRLTDRLEQTTRQRNRAADELI